MTRRERAAVVAGVGIAVLLMTVGFVWGVRATVANGYQVGGWALVAGVVGALGALVGFSVWAVFGPRYRDQED